MLDKLATVALSTRSAKPIPRTAGQIKVDALEARAAETLEDVMLNGKKDSDRVNSAKALLAFSQQYREEDRVKKLTDNLNNVMSANVMSAAIAGLSALTLAFGSKSITPATTDESNEANAIMQKAEEQKSFAIDPALLLNYVLEAPVEDIEVIEEDEGYSEAAIKSEAALVNQKTPMQNVAEAMKRNTSNARRAEERRI